MIHSISNVDTGTEIETLLTHRIGIVTKRRPEGVDVDFGIYGERRLHNDVRVLVVGRIQVRREQETRT